MPHIFEQVTGSDGALSFQFNGQFALKNYNVEIINGNRLKVVSNTNEMFSLLEAEVSEVEINGQIYSDANAAQLALQTLVYSNAKPVVLTEEMYLKLAEAVQAADRGQILPDTPMPSGGWQLGWYTAGVSSPAPGTNYPLQNNLKADEDFTTKFYFNGATWVVQKDKKSKPLLNIRRWEDLQSSDFPLAEGNQVVTDYGYFIVPEGKTASESDIPGHSENWVNLGSDENLSIVLKSFLEDPVGQQVKEYKWTDNDQLIFNISSQGGILNKNNTLFTYSEAGAEFRTWMNVPVSDFDFVDLEFVRIGGIPTGDYVSMIGKKLNGNLETLIAPNSNPATKALENVKISVSGYDSISFTLINFTTNNDGLSTVVKFIKKGGLLGNDAVKKYIDANIAGMYFAVIDVDREGAKGDGVTDDTNVIQSCINKLISQGGGNILFHARTYIVSQITIPNVTNWYTIGFQGAFIPAQRFGTITARPQYPPDYSKPNGTIIKGNSNFVDAVIFGQPGTSYDNFNTAFLSIENITIRTPVENPNIHGVNASNLFQLACNNVNIDTGVYNVDSIEPTNDKSGLITPKNSNCARTLLQGMSISGFAHGIRVFEHTNGNDLQIQSCKNALTFETADHASYFARCCFQRNSKQINVVGQHVFEISQLNMEYAGVGQTTPENAWQSTQFELNDPNNLGIGNITYANVKGGLGKVSTFRINGGAGVIVKKIGSEVKLTGSGIPD